MYLFGLQTTNWMRLKGEQSIGLKPEIYGVTAKWSDNERRSNWAGKTMCLEAIRFGLYGKHRFKSDDSWIFRGEKKGKVVLKLSDGTIIDRSKSIGSSEKLVVSLGEGGAELKGDEAQLYINRIVGMDLSDADSTWYIGQKKTSRFITDDPGARMDVVVGWLRLEPLQQAYESVSEQLSQIYDEIAVLEDKRRVARETMKGVLESVGIIETPEALEELDELIGGAALRCKACNEAVKSFEKQQLDEAENRNILRDAQEYESLLVQGKALRARMDGYSATVPDDEQLKALRAFYDGATVEWSAALNDRDAKLKLAEGRFDGTCPINGCACPIKDQMNAETEPNRVAVQNAQQALDGIKAVRERAGEALAKAEAIARQFAEDARERTRLLERVAKLKPAAERVKSLAGATYNASVESNLSVARNELQKAETERYSLIASKKMVETQKAAFDKADAALVPLRSKAQLFREAQQIFSRQGSQRKIAEVALGEIEAGGNYALTQCGIDLSLKLQWSREGKGLAKVCEGCGAGYPASQKVKVCAKCGLERGPHLVNEFKVELSNVSGAAEDLAGIAMNLSAADWFRRDRQAAWATVILDEPLSACDGENGDMVAGHLPGLLRHFGFVQAFVCSHNAKHVHACPAVLEIIADEFESRIVGGRWHSDLEEKAPKQNVKLQKRVRRGGGPLRTV